MKTKAKQKTKREKKKHTEIKVDGKNQTISRQFFFFASVLCDLIFILFMEKTDFVFLGKEMSNAC